MRTRMSSPWFLYLGCAATLVCSWGSELNAQDVELRSEAGFSLPTRISIQNRVLRVWQKIGMTVGARLTLTFNERFNVVTRVTYVPGYAMLHGAGNRFDVGTSSHLLSGTTGARYWLLPPARKLSLEIHTGVGVVFGGQPAYVDLFETSTVSGVLGTTAHYKVGRIAILQLRVQDRLYRVRFGSRHGGSSRSPLQVSIGLGLPFQESAP
jgi:hypothetical protein